jgi:hypothetical protein
MPGKSLAMIGFMAWMQAKAIPMFTSTEELMPIKAESSRYHIRYFT